MKRVQTNKLRFCIGARTMLSSVAGGVSHAWYVYETTYLRYLCSFNRQLRLNGNMGYVSGSIFTSAGWCPTRAEARRRVRRAKLQKTIAIMGG